MAKTSSSPSSSPFYWNPSGEDISRANNALSTRAGHNLAAGKFSNPRKTFGNSSAIVIPFIGIRAWKDQQKGGTLSLTEENGTDPSFSLPPSTLSLSLSLSFARLFARSLSLVRSPFLDKTDPHSIGGKRVDSSLRVHRWGVPWALIRKTRGWHDGAELRASIRFEVVHSFGCGYGAMVEGEESREGREWKKRKRERRAERRRKKRELLER